MNLNNTSNQHICSCKSEGGSTRKIRRVNNHFAKIVVVFPFVRPLERAMESGRVSKGWRVVNVGLNPSNSYEKDVAHRCGSFFASLLLRQRAMKLKGFGRQWRIQDFEGERAWARWMREKTRIEVTGIWDALG